MGWQTGHLPSEVAHRTGITPNRGGVYQAGLFAACQLAARHCGTPITEFFDAQGQAMRDHLRRRSDFILADGSMPVLDAD